jgi:predicted transcriptional regulator
VERLRVPLAGEGDDLLFRERRKRAEIELLTYGEVFEIADRRLLSVSSGRRQ